MSPTMMAWLLASTVTNERDDQHDLDGFERAILAEQRLMDKLDARELLAVRHEALFDDPPLVTSAPN